MAQPPVRVKSGSLVAPGLPQVADKALMSKIVNTYGKTAHLAYRPG